MSSMTPCIFVRQKVPVNKVRRGHTDLNQHKSAQLWIAQHRRSRVNQENLLSPLFRSESKGVDSCSRWSILSISFTVMDASWFYVVWFGHHCKLDHFPTMTGHGSRTWTGTQTLCQCEKSGSKDIFKIRRTSLNSSPVVKCPLFRKEMFKSGSSMWHHSSWL